MKKPVVPAAAEAPAAEAKPARKTAKSAVKTEKAPKTEKTAHKGRPPLSPEIYVEFAGKHFVCVDKGFDKMEPVDVVIRPEDIEIVPADKSSGTTV